MPYAIPDSRFVMPELFELGRKPLGPVSIDWSNPLTEGLVACYLFQHNQPIVNLAKVDAITNLSNGVAHSPEGLDFFNITKTVDLPPPVGIPGLTDWTVMFRGSKPDGLPNGTSRSIFTMREGAVVAGSFFIYPWDGILTDGLRVSINASSNVIVQPTPIYQLDGLPHDFAIRCQPGSLVANIDNHEIHDSVNSETLNASMTHLSLGGFNTNKQLSLNSHLHHLYIFDRDIGEVKTHGLHEDPYQIFAQPGPSRIMVETASVSSIPYDMYYKTLLSQSVM